MSTKRKFFQRKKVDYKECLNKLKKCRLDVEVKRSSNELLTDPEESLSSDSDYETLTETSDESETSDISSDDDDSTLSFYEIGELSKQPEGARKELPPKVYKYSEKERGNAYFPFPSKTIALLFLWDAQPPRLSRKRFDSLLSVLRNKDFSPKDLPSDCRTLRNWKKKIPLLGVHTVAVSASQTSSRKKKVQRDEPLHTLSSMKLKQVSFFSPLECIQRIFADPILRPHLIFGIEPSECVSEWNQTPYNRQAYAYSRQMGCFHQGTQYLVGDLVTTSTSQNVFRIESFHYDIPQTDEDRPSLHAIARVFNVLPNQELVDTIETTEIAVIEFEGKVIEVPSRAECESKEHFFCHYNIKGEPYFRKTIFLTHRSVQDGKPFAWVEVFIDKFISSETRNKSSTGIYVKLSNVSGSHRNLDEFHKIITWFDSDVDIVEVTKALRADFRKLENSNCVWDVSKGALIALSGAISMLPADWVQLCFNCRHGGANTNLNCPSCWVEKENRMDMGFDIRDQRNRRTSEQVEILTRMAIGEIELEKNSNMKGISENKVKCIRSKYGTQIRDDLDLGVDTMGVSFRDGDHLFYMGFFRAFINFFYDTKLSVKDRRRYQIRLRDLHWPRTVTKPSFTINKTFGKKLSQSIWRQIALGSIWCLEGLLDDKLLKHFAKFVRWVSRYFESGGFSKEMALEWQHQGESLIEEGLIIANPVYDRPNGHNLIHLIKHEIHILLNGNFTRTGSWERQHQWGKKFLTSTGAHLSKEASALNSYNVLDTLKFMVHGGSWGLNYQFKAGSGFIEDGNEMLYHKKKNSKKILFELSGSWNVIGYQFLSQKGKRKVINQGKPTSEEYDRIVERFQIDCPELVNSLSSAKYSYPTGLERQSQTSHSVKLHPGDHVQLLYKENNRTSDEYARVEKFVAVTVRNRTFLLSFITWYTRKLTRKKTQQLHRLSGGILVKKQVIEPSWTFIPVFVGDFLSEVMILHDCIRECRCKRDPCNCAICFEKPYCVEHKSFECVPMSRAPCRTFVRDWHDIENIGYLVFDQSIGFRPEGKKSVI